MFSLRSLSLARYQAADLGFFTPHHVSLQRLKRKRINRLGVVALTTAQAAHSPSPIPSDIRLEQDDDNPFPTAAGFWPSPSQESNRELDLKEAEIKQKLPTEKSSVREEDTHHANKLSTLLPQRTRFKADLSYINLRKWEASEVSSTPAPPAARPKFRENRGLRKILVAYVDHVEPYISALDGDEVSVDRDERYEKALLTVFSPENLGILDASGYQPEDVAIWSWILNSGAIRIAFQRFIAYSRNASIRTSARIPLFLVLQLLRAEAVDVKSFRSLFWTVRDSLQSHSQLSVKDNSFAMWDFSSAVLLLVRLIRHARKVAPSTLQDIADLTPHLLLQDLKAGPVKSEQLSRIYNRLLTLFALPTSVRPFRSIPIQQEAQVSLLRQMLDLQPQLPITREGYRALVRVQLMHEKTSGERDWAMAKALSWPPWRQDKLGIESDLEYPGQQSRALKILNRMREAGYDHAPWEQRATVLAGWDTDKSPTIQTRSLLLRQARAWIAGFLNTGKDPVQLTCDPQLWAARITATRTVREAWACFESYRKDAEKSGKKPQPQFAYHAMFQKLFARTQSAESDEDPLPGDARETFNDPSSSHYMVYVETDPPTAKEFYALMISDGVRPAGRLLTDLVEEAEELREGFEYLNDSLYGNIKKDILVHAEKYPAPFLHDTISSIPDHFFAAFVRLLGRCRPDTNRNLLQQPSSLAMGDTRSRNEGKNISPLSYGSQLLLLSETRYLPAWNGLLDALFQQIRAFDVQKFFLLHAKQFKGDADLRLSWRSVYPQIAIWRKLRQTIHRMQRLEVPPDFTTLRILLSVIETYAMAPSSFLPANEEFLPMAKQLFTYVAHGVDGARWITEADAEDLVSVPDPEDLSAMCKVLVIAQDLDGLLELVNWMHTHSKQLKATHAERRSGNSAMRRTLTFVHVFLNGAWHDERTKDTFQAATEEQMQLALAWSEPFGRPSEDQVLGSTEKIHSWLGCVAFALEERAERKKRKYTRAETLRSECRPKAGDEEKEEYELTT